MTPARHVCCRVAGLLAMTLAGAQHADAQVAGGLRLPTVERRVEVSDIAP